MVDDRNMDSIWDTIQEQQASTRQRSSVNKMIGWLCADKSRREDFVRCCSVEDADTFIKWYTKVRAAMGSKQTVAAEADAILKA